MKNTKQRQQSSLVVTESMLVDLARTIARIGEDIEVNLKNMIQAYNQGKKGFFFFFFGKASSQKYSSIFYSEFICQ